MKRYPIIAFLLSLLAPGTGQLYNGRFRKAVLYYLGLIMLIASLLFLELSQIGLLIWMSLSILLYGFVAADAAAEATIGGGEFQPKTYNRWYVYLIWGVVSVTLLSFVVVPVHSVAIETYPHLQAQPKQSEKLHFEGESVIEISPKSGLQGI